MNEVAVDQAFKFDKYIKNLKLQINRNFLEIARSLKIVRDEKLYEYLDYESFSEYIAQPELSFKRSSVYKLIGIYEKFVDELRVSPDRLIDIEWTKLAETLPVVDAKNSEEMLQKAESLSRSDLRQEIKLLQDPEEKEKEKSYKTCPHCNGTGRIPIDN